MTRQNPPSLGLCYLVAACAAGAAVLGLEVLAARTMAPSIGTGSVAWSALLAVALGSLAAGNFVGGLLADRVSPESVLSWPLVVASGVIILLSQTYAPLMRWAADGSLFWGAVAAAVSTQCVPMLLLGALTPLLITAGSESFKGRWTGAVLACGSGGGIAGALIAGLIILPAFGLSRSYLSIAAVLALAALLLLLVWGRKSWGCTGFALACLAAVLVFWSIVSGPGVVQSPYGQIEIRPTNGRPVLLIDGLPQSGLPEVILPREGLHRGYLLEVALFLRPFTRSALVVGLGAGLAPQTLELYHIKCESVEIDPYVVDTARKEFGFDGRVAVADGRVYLTQTKKQWDLIFFDVCTSDRLPCHLFTVEALKTARKRLTPDGILAIQFIGDNGWWSASVRRTAEAVFGDCVLLAPATEFWPVGPRWLFASLGVLPLPEDIAPPDLNVPWRALYAEGESAIMTDDHFAADLEWSRIAALWRRYYSYID